MVVPASVRVSRVPTYSTYELSQKLLKAAHDFVPTNIRLAKLGIPDYHRLWRNFPVPSACLANFLPYARDGSSCRLMRRLNKFSLHKRLFVVSQPPLNLRLPTYPSVTRRKSKRFGLFQFRSPLLPESLFTFSSSPY